MRTKAVLEPAGRRKDGLTGSGIQFRLLPHHRPTAAERLEREFALAVRSPQRHWAPLAAGNVPTLLRAIIQLFQPGNVDSGRGSHSEFSHLLLAAIYRHQGRRL